jgi:hypothetical protein
MLLRAKQHPEAVCAEDIEKMREAVRIAAQTVNSTSESGKLLLASIIFRYYMQGLSDPQRLAEIAVFSSSSRLFRMPPPRTAGVAVHPNGVGIGTHAASGRIG